MDIALAVLGQGPRKVGELSASVYNCLMFSARVSVSCNKKTSCILKSSIPCLLSVDAEHIKKTLTQTVDLALLRNYRKKSHGSTSSSVSTGAN